MNFVYHLCVKKKFFFKVSFIFFLYFFSTGEPHISEPKYRHSNQHCARAGDDSQGKSGKKSQEISEKHQIISFIIYLVRLL